MREPSPEIGAKLGVALEHVMRIAAALSGSYLRAVKAKAAVAEAEAVAAAVAAAAGDGVPEEEGGGDSGAAVTAAAAGAKAGAGAPIGDGDEGRSWIRTKTGMIICAGGGSPCIRCTCESTAHPPPRHTHYSPSSPPHSSSHSYTRALIHLLGQVPSRPLLPCL